MKSATPSEKLDMALTQLDVLRQRLTPGLMYTQAFELCRKYIVQAKSDLDGDGIEDTVPNRTLLK